MGDDIYTAIVAFSTPSGVLHIGHALGQVAAHTTGLYESMKHDQILFMPLGIHATGKDLLKIISDVESGITPEHYGLSEAAVNAIREREGRTAKVDALVGYYSEVYAEGLEGLGISIDREAFFSTHQNSYHSFTAWTIRKLQEKGLVVETESARPYCGDCGDIKAIEQDQSEARTNTKVDWSAIRVDEEGIHGGEFYCRVHPDTPLTVTVRKENAIDYGNKEMQQETIRLIKEQLKTYPTKYVDDLEGIIKSRREKPMERDARTNTGTPSPLNPKNIIEALSDSNIYMEFYGVTKAIQNGLVNRDQLSDAFYDYIFLDKDTQQDIQGMSPEQAETAKDFIRRYSKINLNVAGYEHKEVHFPFSLFTHAAVLPPEQFPDELILTAHVMRNGEKMSKSKGNVLFLSDAIVQTKQANIPVLSDDAKADAIRLYLLGSQPLDKDLDWSDDAHQSTGVNRLKKFVVNVGNVMGMEDQEGDESLLYDGWLQTKTRQAMETALDAMDQRNYRNAIVHGFDQVQNFATKYLSLSAEEQFSPNTKLLKDIMQKQLALLKPILPRVVDELGSEYMGTTPSQLPELDMLVSDMEKHDAVEYKINPAKYAGSILGYVGAKIGMLKGKQVLMSDSDLKIVVPSSVAKTAFDELPDKKKGLLNQFTYSVVVDNSVMEPYFVVDGKSYS